MVGLASSSHLGRQANGRLDAIPSRALWGKDRPRPVSQDLAGLIPTGDPHVLLSLQRWGLNSIRVQHCPWAYCGDWGPLGQPLA